MYYIGNILCAPSDIKHFGILGMKWGIRRWQNEDGTLNAEGRERYGYGNGVKKVGDKRLKLQVGKYIHGDDYKRRFSKRYDEWKKSTREGSLYDTRLKKYESRLNKLDEKMQKRVKRRFAFGLNSVLNANKSFDDRYLREKNQYMQIGVNSVKAFLREHPDELLSALGYEDTAVGKKMVLKVLRT